MSVAVSCNLSDGLVLGVDSAITLGGGGPSGGVVKVYENADKLFPLGDLPVGIATFGLATLGTRSIGSYIRQFEREHDDLIQPKQYQIATIVEKLRGFFFMRYQETIISALEEQTKLPFSQIKEKPVLGFVIGGYDRDAYLSEIWSILLPLHESEGHARRVRSPGEFGTNWFAMFSPIQRYIKGYDASLFDQVIEQFTKLLGRPLEPSESQSLTEIFARYEYEIPFAAMPMPEGVEHTRFLIGLVINHHRFAVGAPVVGGKAKLGQTYRGESFRVIQ